MGYPKGIPPLPPPRGGEGGLALTVPTYIQPSENVINVLVSVVRDIVVDRFCDIVAGGTVVVHPITGVLGGIVLGTMETTVHLLGRDGGEIGDVGLGVNHRVHA